MIRQLFDKYSSYLFSAITQRRYTHGQILNWLEEFKTFDIFQVKLLGHSIENRPIQMVSIGEGDLNILLWSQMHGDESTATMAIFDLFNFLKANGDEFDAFRKELLSSYTLHFIPVLNPDGLERFQRYNAIGVDLNRDATRLSCPESVILQTAINELQPEFGFNLHDQEIYYTVAKTSKSATISFLAPSDSPAKDYGAVRTKASQVIALLNDQLQEIIPGHVAKYEDEYEPRAFGETIQSKGTSTILVESGGWANDPEKQEIRKLNFLVLLSGFESILNKSYETKTIDDYLKIPFNGKYLFDLLIRNVVIEKGKKKYKVDIGIKRKEVTDGLSFYYDSFIEAIGDLEAYYGYEEFNGEGFHMEQPKINKSLNISMVDLKPDTILGMLKQGYTHLSVDEVSDKKYLNQPINMVQDASLKKINSIMVNGPANFTLVKNERINVAIINGFMCHLDNPSIYNGNGLVI